MADVIELGGHDRMSVIDALDLSLRQAAELQCVMVIGFDQEGLLVCRSSQLSRAEANWLLDSAKQHALFGNTTLAVAPAEVG